jgi:glycosyltransferase involved in cell wall biosynthesis
MRRKRAPMQLIFDWQVSAYFGWGVYGLNLALELALDPSIEARTVRPLDPRRIGVDAMRLQKLGPFLARTNGSPAPRNGAWLQSLGNNFLPTRLPQSRIGVVFFEGPLSAEGLERAKGYDAIVAGSSWNAEILKAAGLPNVRMIMQGLDRSLFHPAPKRNLFPGRFLIFSGGKPEPRKGQDIVVAAFRIFARRHPEAMLVTAWHTDWPHLAQGMDLDLSAFPDRVISIGALPNGHMAAVYRECDVALFTNRAEGGTNLVAMECLACGLPTILSDNTGHRDLLRMGLGYRLAQAPGMFPGWGESNVKAVVDALEWAFRNAKPTDGAPQLPQWSDATAALLSLARDVYKADLAP